MIAERNQHEIMLRWIFWWIWDKISINCTYILEDNTTPKIVSKMLLIGWQINGWTHQFRGQFRQIWATSYSEAWQIRLHYSTSSNIKKWEHVELVEKNNRWMSHLTLLLLSFFLTLLMSWLIEVSSREYQVIPSINEPQKHILEIKLLSKRVRISTSKN